jgi:hypothetical protein
MMLAGGVVMLAVVGYGMSRTPQPASEPEQEDGAEADLEAALELAGPITPAKFPKLTWSRTSPITMFSGGSKSAPKKGVKKPAPKKPVKKPVAKKPAPKKPVKKVAPKKPVKRVAPKKPVGRKPVKKVIRKTAGKNASAQPSLVKEIINTFVGFFDFGKLDGDSRAIRK